jgi:hypothetical protein
MPTFAPVKNILLIQFRESWILAQINNGLFLCPIDIYII